MYALKVRNVNRTEYGLNGIRESSPHGDDGVKSVVFQKTLSALSGEQYETHMNALIGEIEKQGEKLANRADIKEFEKYRELIRNFIDEIVSNGYSFSKDNAFAARGRHRFFATVKTVDEKLDALAKEVLSGQADSIELLHRIDDIRGLILDMML